MNSPRTSQANLLLLLDRPSGSSLRQPIISDQNSIDTYDYQDLGPSNTPSKKRDGKIIWPTQPQPQGSQVSGNPDNILAPEEFVKQVETNIYEREMAGRRARQPDNREEVIELHAIPKSPTAAGLISSSSQSGRRKDRSRRNNQVAPILPSRAAEKTKLRRVMLDWRTGQTGDKQHLILHATQASTNAVIEPRNSVVWSHSDFEDIKLSELETLVAQLKCCGLQDSDVGLTGRLLKRVRLVSERDFVGGRFLAPIAIRYDMLDNSRYSIDKCCIFLKFPYLTVQRPRQGARFKKGDENHPTRTLLQSRYRLNETTQKDETQCIRMLDGQSLRSCIKAGEAETSHLASSESDDLIYVPQMWALIVGLDHMVTAGPISDKALQGSVMRVEDDAVPGNSLKRTFVRISFVNHGMPDEVTYPLEQCASWFGLLNKHQQIRDTLRQGNEKAALKDYPLKFGRYSLDDRSLASVQRSVDGEILRIWMENPKPSQVTLKKADRDSGSEEAKMYASDDESLIESRSVSSMTSAKFKRLDKAPIVKAFLAWRVVDDFGERDNSLPEIQTKGYLNAISVSLSASTKNNQAQAATTDVPGPQSGRSARLKTHIKGGTRREVEDLGSRKSDEKHELSIEQEQDHRRYLNDLLSMFKKINALAERIHLGVHVQRLEQTAAGGSKYYDDISEGAILQASMVDALGAVLNMLVEAVRIARQRHGSSEDQGPSLGKRVQSHANEACKLLDIARNELITEASGMVPGENVGPVVTPEAILIMSMDRLVRGVFGTGSVDVINILEECLEQLALRVENHSSRRLLQKLNAFEEEVDVVSDVLLQQTKVLSEFREYLDPGGFKKPTTARKMRFSFERQGIDRTLTHIYEQLRHCKELRERAKVLAVQNVQLVETLADDNGRAIFVFTFITVLFLPFSFVAGFYGMNLAGVSNTEAGVSRFWYIAVPLTVGIMVLCAIFVAWGESIWFAAADVLRRCKRLFVGNGVKTTRL